MLNLLRPPTSYADVIRNMPGLVQYWRLDEPSGTRAYDQARVGNGTYTGAPALGVTSIVRDGAAMRTTTAGGTWMNGGNAAIPSTAYSLTCWLLAGSNTDKGIFGQWSSNVGGLLYQATATTIGFIHRGTTAVSGAQTMGVWHFLAGTWDGSNARLYIDGRLAAGPSANSTAPGTGSNWVVGSYAVSGSFANRVINGSIAEAAYWNRALTLSETAHLYAIGCGR